MIKIVEKFTSTSFDEMTIEVFVDTKPIVKNQNRSMHSQITISKHDGKSYTEYFEPELTPDQINEAIKNMQKNADLYEYN